MVNVYDILSDAMTMRVTPKGVWETKKAVLGLWKKACVGEDLYKFVTEMDSTIEQTFDIPCIEYPEYCYEMIGKTYRWYRENRIAYIGKNSLYLDYITTNTDWNKFDSSVLEAYGGNDEHMLVVLKYIDKCRELSEKVVLREDDVKYISEHWVGKNV